MFTRSFLFAMACLSGISSAMAAQQKSYITYESGGDPTGSQNYSLDIDHASRSGSRYLFGTSYSVLSTETIDYPGGSVWLGYGTDTSKKWSQRLIYEFAKFGDNLDTNMLSYSLNASTNNWTIETTVELGRIGVFAGMPLTRAEIDRAGMKLNLNYATNGPWQFRLSGALNNFYGDPSVIPTFIFIMRFTSAGLFANNFYKQKVGMETTYALDHGSLSIGAEQSLVGTERSNSLYLSSLSELSKKLSVRAEAGNTLSGSFASGWYGLMGITYAY